MRAANGAERVVFLIRSLNTGGAERQLVQLATGLHDKGLKITVMAMYPGGPLESELRARSDFDYVMLGKRGRADVIGFGVRLLSEIKRRKPSIVHGYMPFANELALLAGRASGAKVVWGIRSSYIDFKHYGLASRGLFWTGRFLSHLPDLLIVNSWRGRNHHANAGYDPSRMVVIPNGIDTALFRPDATGGTRMRAKWGIPANVPLVGIVGRIEPMKGYSTFLHAAAIVGLRSSAHFVCIGGGDPEYRRLMEAKAVGIGCDVRVHWLGTCTDMPAAYAALNVLVSASLGEGFSNVIGEAMASGVRCVVTDVGDSARIVGNTGVVVSVGDAHGMARGVMRLLDQTTHPVGDPRARVEADFSCEAMIHSTAAALRSIT